MTKILFFTQENCVPCRRVKPVMKEIAEDFPAVEIDELDINVHRKVTNEFNIMSTPTLVVLDEDGLEVNRVTGAKPKVDMVDALGLIPLPPVEKEEPLKGVVTSHHVKRDRPIRGTI